MIKIEKVSIAGLEPAIRGMRNPMNSWDKSDSHAGLSGDEWSMDPGFIIGEKDHDLAMRLSKNSVEAKYRRQIVVWADITAPLYWWKEMDTYRMGIEKNSCSTMHKITEKPFDISDFSHEHLFGGSEDLWVLLGDGSMQLSPIGVMTCAVIPMLNEARELYLRTTDPAMKKAYWWQMIQLLPSSYNQKRTCMMSYEMLSNVYQWRKCHKLDEWRLGNGESMSFCDWIETLPYSEVITGERD